jgi:selenocysteine-specific translation elongation factor
MSSDQDLAHHRLCQLAIGAFEQGVSADDAVIDLALTAMHLHFELEEAEQIIRSQYKLCAERETLEQTLQRLARLGAAAYEQLRESEVKRLRMRRTVLDTEVEKLRAKARGERQATSTGIPSWPPLVSTCQEPVDG